jgi:CRISPR-associated protein Csx10
MVQLFLSLMTTSPLAIRADHAPGGSKTATIVNGSTLLGSLAAAHRMLYTDTKNDDFVQLFLKGNIFYPNLYPANFDPQEALGDEMQASHSPIYPLPKTAQSCKRFEGFLKEFSDERHGVRDSLLDWAAFKLSNGKSVDALRKHARCSYLRVGSKEDCEEVMDHFSGFYRRAAFVEPPYHRMIATVDTRLLTRTGINRDWDIVEEGILYNREVIDEEAYFWGMITLPDELLPVFKGFVEEADDARLIRIGTGRTRGLGQVQFTIHSVEDDEIFSFDSFKQRLMDFDAELRKRMEYPPADEDDHFYFALTLHSPVILRDDFLRYRGTISGEVLATHAKLTSKTLRLQQIHQVTSVEQVTGWNELWGTPRMQEYAIATGSVFLFVSTEKVSEELQEKLFELENQGIGERRAEGFGRICFSDPFHLEEDRV